MRDWEITNASHSHDLLAIPKQGTNSQVSCLCRYCRFHFVFILGQPAATSFNDPSHLQHFFYLKHSESQSELEKIGDTEELYPLVSRTTWECHCGTCLTLEISSPRLRPEWIATITDEDRIQENIRLAKIEDPERYKDVDDAKAYTYKTSPLSTLNIYLANILDDTGTGKPKRISVRNKTFTAQFGESCERIFQGLGFIRQTEEGESYWLPPRLAPEEANSKTALRSVRAFYQDVKSEVQSIIDTRPSVGQRQVMAFELAWDPLWKLLGCDKYSWPDRIRPGMSKSDEQQNLWILGAPVKSGDVLLEYAYRRQITQNPSDREAYLLALSNLASNGGSEDHQKFCFAELDNLSKANLRADEDGFDIHAAFKVLGVEEKTDLDTVANVALAIFHDNPELVLKAISKVIAHYEETGDYNLPILRNVYQNLQDRGSSTQQEPLPPPPPPEGGMPVGLINIRNTCYLNSLLQYMYTISDIRDFVLNYPDLDLEPTESSVADFMIREKVKTKRGLPSEERNFLTGEAYLGYMFAIELRELFRRFEAAQKDETRCIAPSQRLVNTAMIRSDDANAVKFHENAKAAKEKSASVTPPPPATSAPPLPPRPTDGETEDLEAASDMSDETMVEEVVKDIPEVDTRNRPSQALNAVEKLAEGVNSTEVKGTAQEDIQEAWTNIKDHLEAAAILIGLEPSTHLFTTTTCEHKRLLSTDWAGSVQSVDFFSLFPSARGAPDLCNAMAFTFFDLEVMDQVVGGKVVEGDPWLKFTTIKKTAPHLHIFIHRNVGNTKNQGQMNMPEKIDLGRFKSEPTSSTFEEKKREWEVRARLNEIKPMRMVREIKKGEEPVEDKHVQEFLQSLGNGMSTDMNEADDGLATARDLCRKHGVEFSEAPLPRIEHDLSKWTAPHPRGWGNLWYVLEEEEAKQEEQLTAEWHQLLENQAGDPYVLHAAFCHGGATKNAGHYWVYIRDFEQNVWRKYNDSTVTVVGDPVAEIFENDNPEKDERKKVYYLSYIKESETEKLVSVPRRQVQKQSEDAEMEGTTAEHIEDVEMVTLDNLLEGSVADE
ncbi:hypothetical protein QBC44DRAFT_238207 [Cladorrhinum sp. PSN332]|nr:hypothetical protein QBC44DRAFT_238207 [Cladorrhinum sp. PSN332]